MTWAKGLDEVTGRPFVNPEAHYGNDSITIAPGPGGAHNWAPMSFNPTTGLVYIPTSTNSTSNYAVDPNFKVENGKSNTGLLRGGRGGGNAGGNAGAPQAARRNVCLRHLLSGRCRRTGSARRLSRGIR